MLERIDATLSNILPLLYLAGLALGAAAYFSGVILDVGIAVGIGLACAAEIHSFLAQRRTRAAYALFQRAAPGTPEREEYARQAWVNGGILALLLAFSAFNAWAFNVETWHTAQGFLPYGVQLAVRSLIIPVLFFLAGFLVPLTTDAGALLASAAHSMLHTTIKATVKQWQRRVRRARKRGIDLAPVAIALMEDAGDTDGARRIQMIAQGLDAAETATNQRIGRGIPLLDAPASLATYAPASLAPHISPAPRADLLAGLDAGPDSPDDTPPTGGPGGGRPGKGTGKAGKASRSGQQAPATLALVPPPGTANTGRGTARADAGRSREEAQALWERDTDMAREILAQVRRSGEEISTRQLARRLSDGRPSICHPTRAASVRLAIEAGEASEARQERKARRAANG
jgi:hypothetical protein